MNFVTFNQDYSYLAVGKLAEPFRSVFKGILLIDLSLNSSLSHV